MECVIDTSAISWMDRIGYVNLLPEVYDRIYAPPAVFRQLAPHYATRDFVQAHVEPIHFSDEKSRRRFYRIVNRWKKKHGLRDIADFQVFVGYRFFTDANEALYANKGAERLFSEFGNVRDIMRVYELAEQRGIFSRSDTLDFLNAFLRTEKPYRSEDIVQLISDLS